MPQLPFTTFTSQVSAGAPGAAPPIPNARIKPAFEPQGAGQAISRFGAEITKFGQVLQRRQEEKETRTAQVENARVGAAFAEDLANAKNTGEEFEPIQEKWLAKYDEVNEGLSTRAGTAQFDFNRAKLEASFAGSIRQAESKRAGTEARVQTQDMLNIQGAVVAANPAGLEAAIEELDAFVDTFSNLSAGDREIIKQSSANDLTVAAANSLLRSDPLTLQSALGEKGTFPDMTPPQRAQFLARTDSELKRRENAAESKNEMAKLQLAQSLRREAEDHVLTNEEAPDYFERGGTASQFESARRYSIQVQGAKDTLANNVNAIQVGAGSVLTQDAYENALTRMTTDATAGMEPEDAANMATEIRMIAATANGRVDRKLQSILNAGPAGGDATFAAGLDLRARLKEMNPELYNKMVDSKSSMWYNAYEFMTEQLGIAPESARGRLLDFSENRKEAEARLGSKENRELIEDEIGIGFAGQNFAVRSLVKDIAVGYMALVPSLTPKQAIDLAANQWKESTVELNHGVRAKAADVPLNWEEADDYVRRFALTRELTDAGIQFDVNDISGYIFIPAGNGRAAVIDPSTGLTVFTNFNWQGAVSEWFTTVGQPSFEEEQRLTAQKKAENDELVRRSRKAVAGIPGIGLGAAIGEKVVGETAGVVRDFFTPRKRELKGKPPGQDVTDVLGE